MAVDGARTRDLRAEPLCLQRRPLDEFTTGDPRGEPDVVLDATARPRLPADTDTVHQQRLQALGRAVDGSGEPGGAGTDDHDVEQFEARRFVHEPEVGGQLADGRVAEHGDPRHDDRRVGRTDTEAGEEFTDTVGVIAVEVDPLVREVLALHVAEQFERSAGVPRTDDAQRCCAGATADDLPPGHEGGEDDVADLGIAGEQATELTLVDPQDPAVVAHPTPQEAALAREQAQFTEEPAGSVGGDDRLTVVGVDVDDVGLTVEDHDQVVVALAFDEQRCLRPSPRARRRRPPDEPVAPVSTSGRPSSRKPRRRAYCGNNDPVPGVAAAMATATWNGTVIAQSDDTVVVENNHYFPIESVVDGVLVPSDHTSVCPWKGTASYYSLEVDGRAQPRRCVVLPGTEGSRRRDHRTRRLLARRGRHPLRVGHSNMRVRISAE